MATIVNNPATTDNGNGNSVMVAVALVVMLGLVFVFFFYGLPFFRGGYGNNNAPAAPQTQQGSQQAAPEIKVPDKIDVNINQPK